MNSLFRRALVAVASIGLLGRCSYAQSPKPQKPISFPPVQGQTIPNDVITSMARQEERLSDIKDRMATLEHHMDDFKHDVEKRLDGIDGTLKELSSTNNVMSFIIWIFKLAIGLTVPTLFGIWFNKWLNRRAVSPPATPNQ
jgi:hypothetical protein